MKDKAITEFEVLTDKGANLLRYAIIKQACKDYYTTCLDREITQDKSWRREEIMNFFYSDYFKGLCKVPAEKILKEIEYRAKKGLKLFKTDEEDI